MNRISPQTATGTLAMGLALVVGAGEPALGDPAYSVGVCVAHPQWNPCTTLDIAEGALAQVGPQSTPASLNGGKRVWYNNQGVGTTINYGLHPIRSEFNTSSTWVIADTGPDRIEGTMYSGASNAAFGGAVNAYSSECQQTLTLDDVVFTNTGFAGTEFTASLNLSIDFAQTLDISSNGTNTVSLVVSAGLNGGIDDVEFAGDHSGTVQLDVTLGTLQFDTPYTLLIDVQSAISSEDDGSANPPVLASQVDYAVEFASGAVFGLPPGVTADSAQGAIVDNAWSPPPACAGDLDGDGATTVLDFGVFSGNFGRTDLPPGTGGDMDGDGDCDVLDFGLWTGDFGCGTG